MIKDFGVVPMEDRTFSAGLSFEDGQCGATPTPGTSGGEGTALPATGGAALGAFVAGGILVRRLAR